MYRGLTVHIILGVIINGGLVGRGVALKFEPVSELHQSYMTKYNLNYLECVDTCDRRVRCVGAMYSQRRKECLLTDTPIDSVADSTSMKYAVYRKPLSAGTLQLECGDEPCTLNQVCVKETNTCEILECDRFDVTGQLVVSGNVQTVGSKILVDCMAGTQRPDGKKSSVYTCNTSGVWETDAECVPVTCKEVWSANNGTGEYYSYDTGSRKIIKIFCIFYQDHGYTFISQEYINDVTDLSPFYTRSDQVMVRHYRNNQQFEGKIELLPEYSSLGNITILLNDYGDFPEPTSIKLNESYIYLQLLPPGFVFNIGVLQGYTFEGSPVHFLRTLDPENFNYLLVHAGNMTTEAEAFEVNCRDDNPVGCDWIGNAIKVIPSEMLPDGYFYNYSMRMGGGGVRLHRVVSRNGQIVTGVVFGLRFDL